MFEESGIHYFEDGHFWVEVPGLPMVENVEDLYHVPPKAKQKNRVKFSSDPIRVRTLIWYSSVSCCKSPYWYDHVNSLVSGVQHVFDAGLRPT